jgi:hypothetical protein
MDIEKIIKALRESDAYIETIFTQGSCYKFHLFLKSLYPKAVPVINEEKDHIGTLIHTDVYDITGKVSGNYNVMADYEIELAQTWSFSKSRMLQLGECPVCEEPLVV